MYIERVSPLRGPRRSCREIVVARSLRLELLDGAEIRTLGDDERDLRDTITDFRGDEMHHRDVSLRHGAESAPAYPVLTGAIKAGTRLELKGMPAMGGFPGVAPELATVARWAATVRTV